MILLKSIIDTFSKNKLNIIFLSLLWSLLFITSLYHEPWSDEARAWLVARQYSLKELLHFELGYEGHPVAWYIPLEIFTYYNLPVYSMQLFCVILSMITSYLIIFNSPFSRLTKILICMSYFFAYQYTIIARSYVLLTCCLVIFATLWKSKSKYPIFFSIILGIIANTSAHGILIVLGIGLHLMLSTPSLKKLCESCIKNWLTLFIVSFSVLFSLLTIIIPSDVNFVKLSGNPTSLLTQAISCIKYSISSYIYLALFLLTILTVHLRSTKTSSLFIITFLFLFIFMVMYYGKPWHAGIIFVWIIISYWVHLEKYTQNKNNFLALITSTILGIVLMQQAYWSYLSFRYDLANNYSAAAPMANFIKKHKLNKYSIATNSYNGEAIMPYFKKLCFVNWNYGAEPCLFQRKKSHKSTTNLKGMASWPDLYLLARRMDVAEFDLFKKNYQKIIHIDGGMWIQQGIFLKQNYELWCRKNKCPVIKN